MSTGPGDPRPAESWLGFLSEIPETKTKSEKAARTKTFPL